MEFRQVCHAELREDAIGVCDRFGRRERPWLRGALHRDSAEQPLRRRRTHQVHHLAAAARLAENRHGIRVTAEVGDVVLNPLQAEDQVELADVRRVLVLRAVLFKIQEAKNIQAMVQSHHDDVAPAREALAIVGLQFLVRPGGVTASVNPDETPRASGCR